MASDFRLRVSLFVLALVTAASGAYAQPTSGDGVLQASAPMFLAPDPKLTPLATLPAGTNVQVVAKEGDWYRVVYQDRYLGNRTGYVAAAYIRIEPPAPPGTRPRPGPRPGMPAPPAGPTPSTQPVIISATPMRTQQERGYLWLSGMYQHESTAFTAVTTFTQNAATANLTTSYDGVHSAVADVTLGVRVWRSLSVAVAATRSAQVADAAVTASIPSPIDGRPRTVSGRASAINRQELGIHLDVAWSVPATGRAQIVIFAGPTLYKMKQGLVTGVSAQETFPVDSLIFTQATVVESRKSRLGANGGVEASVRLWKALGVGGLARFSRATVPFAPVEGTNVKIRAGGLQVGGGLHFHF